MNSASEAGTPDKPTTDEGADAGADDIAGGSYDLIASRLLAQAKELGEATDKLNGERTAVFGGAEFEVSATARVRTENNCVPCDIVQVDGRLLFAYNVFIGLKRETAIGDVFSLRDITADASAPELHAVAADNDALAFLNDPAFLNDFQELYRFYKETRLTQLIRNETSLLAAFRIGARPTDVRVFRWAFEANGLPTYVDSRGERDYALPDQHDFEWVPATRDDHVSGRFPHIDILDQLFVETIGGDLTIKVENNTEHGEGIYSEPVDEPNQSLDDAQIRYAQLGSLIVLDVLPYREDQHRYLVVATRTQQVARIDAVGQACVALPEDHGVIFPGGYFLQDGQYKVFDGDFAGFEYERTRRSPNGEDVLYVFHQRSEGRYALFAYNLIRKTCENPILCHGYSLFPDGRMAVFRANSEEPTRIHPLQFWTTPFTSDEYSAATETGTGVLQILGNAELVRGISDAYSIRRAIAETVPSRRVYEDLIGSLDRISDGYHWLGAPEAFDLLSHLTQIKGTAELIIDEFDKVVAIRARAKEALAEASEAQRTLLRDVRPDTFQDIAQFMDGLTRLRRQRGHVITLRDVRYIDLQALDTLDEEIQARFDLTSQATAQFLLGGKALAPLQELLNALLSETEACTRTAELTKIESGLDQASEGLTVLSEVIASIEVDDPTERTTILEGISEVFSLVNRVRATFDVTRKGLLSEEGKAEFGAQFQLFSQAVTSAVGLADTPDKCDSQLSRLMVQLEELEARFSEFDEFITLLSDKREEVHEAFEQRKQQQQDELQRRAQNLVTAAERILSGIDRRSGKFKEADDLNAFFAADPMVGKLRELMNRIRDLGDGPRAEELASRLQSAQQNAVRGLRDRLDLYEDGDGIIKLGRHRFAVNTDPLDLTLLATDEQMSVHIAGTDFAEPITDPEFAKTRPFWNQRLPSEDDGVYRAEYLAVTLLLSAEQDGDGLTLQVLRQAVLSPEGLAPLVHKQAANRFAEGYERGLHDADATLILEQLLHLRDSVGLLRYSSTTRAMAALYWAFQQRSDEGQAFQRQALSHGKLQRMFEGAHATRGLSAQMSAAAAAFFDATEIPVNEATAREMGPYLVAELAQPMPKLCTSRAAQELVEKLRTELERNQRLRELEQDLSALLHSDDDSQDDNAVPDVKAALGLACAWVDAFTQELGSKPSATPNTSPVEPSIRLEAAVLLLTNGSVEREVSHAASSAQLNGLLGQHKRIVDRTMHVQLDEMMSRVGSFIETQVPGYTQYQKQRQALLHRERDALRLSEFTPRVLTSFVRNKLINDVYLPIIGDNLAKQMGAVGDGKRTDLMGLLLLISPPGYGKTTLMEYVASRLGLVFMKVNGPSLGHSVTSLDPTEASSATARQEVEKVNLAFEMGNNVMLYLDDIQHTHPEFLQKFISLCDGQRRIEGVWRGKTQTYDLRGKRFCVVMAGNPYTESGEKFQVPDMLSNRADTYNLGDIFGGQEDTFALSYIENAITSNPTLASLANRDLKDIYALVRMAQGEEVPSSALSYDYAQIELNEITKTLQHLFVVRDVLLAVNQEYIASASMDDNYRTEPPFKLQGSYRNMAKLAEKVVPAMNPQELQQLIVDHYQGEAQTLTSGAEQNLLKLAELRGALSGKSETRWNQIKKDFRRLNSLGGSEDDPVVRVVNQLHGLGEHLSTIRDTLQTASEKVATQNQAQAATPNTASPDWFTTHLGQLDKAVTALANPELAVTVQTTPPAGVEELLGQQVALVERALVPLVQAATSHLHDNSAFSKTLGEVLGVTRAIAERVEFLEGVVVGEG